MTVGNSELLTSLSELLTRDISKIQEEIGLYKKETRLWTVVDGISNSGGNLALHIAGNLQYFIGATLGNTDYVRQRELEFSAKDFPATKVIEELKKAKDAVESTLAQLTEEDLHEPFPLDVFKNGMTTRSFLLHLLSHTNYHLGQINYHRRMLNSIR